MLTAHFTGKAQLKQEFMVVKMAFVFVLLIGRKEMSYLMMHSTHFIYGYIASGI